MAGRETVFGESEKIHLLTEIIRSSIARPEDLSLEVLPRLLEIVNRFAPDPRWYNIVPPAGRNILACQRALDLMRQFTPSNVSLAPYGKGPDFPRPLPYDPSVPGPQLAPRPPGYPGPREGYASSYGAVGPLEPPTGRKKRGRPSNREKEEQARKAAATGQPLPAPRPPRPPKRNRPTLPPSSFTPANAPTLTPMQEQAPGPKPFEDFIPGIPTPLSASHPPKQPDKLADQPAPPTVIPSISDLGVTSAGTAEPQPEPRSASREPPIDARSERRPELQPQARPEIRPGSRPEVRPELQPAPQPELRHEPRPPPVSPPVEELPRPRLGSVPPTTMPDLRPPPRARSRTKSPGPEDQKRS